MPRENTHLSDNRKEDSRGRDTAEDRRRDRRRDASRSRSPKRERERERDKDRDRSSPVRERERDRDRDRDRSRSPTRARSERERARSRERSNDHRREDRESDRNKSRSRWGEREDRCNKAEEGDSVKSEPEAAISSGSIHPDRARMLARTDQEDRRPGGGVARDGRAGAGGVGVCYDFQSKGKCRFESKCRFSHSSDVFSDTQTGGGGRRESVFRKDGDEKEDWGNSESRWDKLRK
jgi:hypothetical protein